MNGECENHIAMQQQQQQHTDRHLFCERIWRRTMHKVESRKSWHIWSEQRPNECTEMRNRISRGRKRAKERERERDVPRRRAIRICFHCFDVRRYFHWNNPMRCESSLRQYKRMEIPSQCRMLSVLPPIDGLCVCSNESLDLCCHCNVNKLHANRAKCTAKI